MNMSNYFSARDVLVLLEAPASITYPSGGVRIDKAGIGGEGPTPVAAAADWCRKFSAMIVIPKLKAAEEETEESDTDLEDTLA